MAVAVFKQTILEFADKTLDEIIISQAAKIVEEVMEEERAIEANFSQEVIADLLDSSLEEENVDRSHVADDILLLAANVASSVPPVNKGWENELKIDENDNLKSDAELLDFIKENRNENTTKKTEQILKKFRAWLSEKKNEERKIEDIEPGKLNNYIGNYILSLKKQDGGDFEPDTLTSYHRAIDR